MRGVRAAAICLLGVGLALTACGADESEMGTGEGEGTVTREGAGVRAEDEGLEGQIGPDAALPEAFPDDVPLPSDGEIVESIVSESLGFIVTVRSERPVAEIAEAMRRDLEAQGWVLQEGIEAEGQYVIPATKGRRLVLAQVAEIGGGVSHVILNVAEQPEE